MRTAQTSIFEATPQSSVLQSSYFRKTKFPPRRCRGRSTSPLFSAGKSTCRKGRRNRATQSNRPNEVGSEDEQHPRACDGNCLFRRGVRMRKRKYYLHLTNTEHRFIIQCLLDLRNRLLSQGKYTDGLDEVIIKFSK